MLTYLLDAHISPKVAEQIRAKRPEIRIDCLSSWRGGMLLNAEDDEILQAAHEESLTLVTYDQSTIIPLVTRWAEQGREHAGVIFVDDRSILQEDIGSQVRALISLWDSSSAKDWTNGIQFLKSPSR
ncbi:MAG TPA: DUF5615 family PIN-like protein [Chthonomonadaceae bacterium]|nr:DUF5615 family PIN-like protein [Chthonomonadaceae bacterium]